MTVVVTRDVVARIRGFLASCMLEIAPGTYASPKMTRAVRERVWRVLSEWFTDTGGGSVLLVWRDAGSSSGLRVETLGTPPKTVVDADGVFLARATDCSSDESEDEIFDN